MPGRGADESRGYRGHRTVAAARPALPAWPVWSSWRVVTLVSVALSVLLAGGCVSVEPRGALPFSDAPALSEAGEATVASAWWTAFDDAGLTARVEEALSGNFDLAAAWARLRASRAVARRESAALLPSVDGTAGAGYEASSDGDSETDLSLGLVAAYELDLWGRIDSAVEAERLRAQADREAYRTATLTLAARIASAWFGVAEANAELDLIRRQIDTNEQALIVLRKRFATGQISSADVLRQQQLVEATREQLLDVSSRREVLEHQLAVLVGRPPQGGLDALPTALPALPPLPQGGVPAELVQQRPDVRAALRRLDAADADLASAVSDQYPRLNLGASLSTSAERPGDLFQDWLFSLSGQLVAPLFDAGRRRAEIDRAESLRAQRIAEYGQVVLVAFQEVEDALARERYITRRIESIARQLELARQTLSQLRTQYVNGVTSYLSVLEALTEMQRLEREALTAELSRLEFRVALYRALAGGYQSPREAEDRRDATVLPDRASVGEAQHIPADPDAADPTRSEPS